MRFFVATLYAAAALAQNDAGPYKPEWDSLRAHRDPAWFRDAKLGIYTHWGPVTYAAEDAPASMEWYGNQMYIEKHAAFKYHQQRFGDQHTVGYKDVISRFTAPARGSPGRWPCITTISPCGIPRRRAGTARPWGRGGISPANWKRPSASAG